MKYRVHFTKWYTYEVDADNEDEAFDLGYDEFVAEMRRPVADTSYDDAEVEEDG